MTYLIRHYSDLTPAPHRKPSLVLDLPVRTTPLRGKLPAGIGDQVHAAFFAAVDGDFSLPYSDYARVIRDWILAQGARQIRAEWELTRGVRGRCDAWVTGGYCQQPNGIVEIKTVHGTRLPNRYPHTDDEHQLGLYARAAAPFAWELWGAIAYVVPTEATIRVFVFRELDAHALAAGRLHRAAA